MTNFGLICGLLGVFFHFSCVTSKAVSGHRFTRLAEGKNGVQYGSFRKGALGKWSNLGQRFGERGLLVWENDKKDLQKGPLAVAYFA